VTRIPFLLAIQSLARNIELTNIYAFKFPGDVIPGQSHLRFQISRQRNLLPVTLNEPILAHSNFQATQFLARNI